MSGARICKFCGMVGKMTREHVFSKAVLRQFDEVAPLTIDNIRGKAHKADPVISYLCARCNNNLSPLDEAISCFCRDYLTQPIPIGTLFDYQSEAIERWVAKTVVNCSIFNNVSNDWWEILIPFIQGLDQRPASVSLYFGVWKDHSPFQVAERLNIVTTIQANECIFEGFISPLTNEILIAWSVKVGFGVFLLVVWRNDVLDEEISFACESELCSSGWLKLPGDRYVAMSPFGQHPTNLSVIYPRMYGSVISPIVRR